MKSDATTVDEYLEELPEDRRATLQAVRRVVLEHLPAGYEEGMQYGMIGYYIPLDRYPDTYNGEALAYLGLAAQKRHYSLYLMGVYASDEEAFRARYEATGKRLDMGKSCLRFRRLDELALDVIAEEIARVSPEDFIAVYEASRGA